MKTRRRAYYGRFVFSPIPNVDSRLKAETAELKSDVDNLGKKLQYLETTHKNSQEVEVMEMLFFGRAKCC
jgi:hypothetical protein